MPAVRAREVGVQVMVTGGAGFIGSNLVDRLLAEGHAVDVVDNLSTGSLANLAEARASASHALTFHQLDVRSDELVEVMARRRPEVVFHLAAQADVRVSVQRPVFDADVNILGTLRVLEGARAAGTARVAFAASGGTLYGECDPAELPVKESHPRRPLSPYGVSKMSAIDYLVAYRELHALEFCALALANVYGPRQDPHGEAGVVAIFSDRLLEGEPVTIFGDGEQTRDFVYVDDVVDAFVRAGTRGGGLVLNIGNGTRGVGQRAGPRHGRTSRVRRSHRSMLRPGRERSSAAPSTPNAPASIWDGGPGPRWATESTACSATRGVSRLADRGGRRVPAGAPRARRPGEPGAALSGKGLRRRAGGSPRTQTPAGASCGRRRARPPRGPRKPCP